MTQLRTCERKGSVDNQDQWIRRERKCQSRDSCAALAENHDGLPCSPGPPENQIEGDTYSSVHGEPCMEQVDLPWKKMQIMESPCWIQLLAETLTPKAPMLEQLFPEAWFFPWEELTLEQLLKNFSQWKGPMVDQFVKDSIPWEEPLTGLACPCDKEGMAKCYGTTSFPIPLTCWWGR